MTTRTKTTAIAVAAILIMTASGFALAQGPGNGPGNGPGRGAGRGAAALCDGDGPGFGGGRGIARLAARLDLSEDQVKTITAIQEKNREANQGLRKDLLKLRHELEGQMLQDEPDAKAVKGLVAKIGDLRTKMQQNRMETRLAVRAQLTPEQRDKMILMGEGRGFGKGGRHGGRGGHFGQGGGRQGCDGDGPRGGFGPGRGFDGDCPRQAD